VSSPSGRTAYTGSASSWGSARQSRVLPQSVKRVHPRWLFHHSAAIRCCAIEAEYVVHIGHASYATVPIPRLSCAAACKQVLNAKSLRHVQRHAPSPQGCLQRGPQGFIPSRRERRKCHVPRAREGNSRPDQYR
jgi:hypothetical protein